MAGVDLWLLDRRPDLVIDGILRSLPHEIAAIMPNMCTITRKGRCAAGSLLAFVDRAAASPCAQSDPLRQGRPLPYFFSFTQDQRETLKYPRQDDGEGSKNRAESFQQAP
jgi:hypothetical protein